MNVANKDDQSRNRAPTGKKYQDSAASLEELVAQMPEALQKEWGGFGHLRVEPAFQDRVFVVYEATGKDGTGAQRAPKVKTTVRVLSFLAKDELGCIVRVADDATGREMEIGHVPTRLFDFPIYVAIPPMFTIRWDLRQHAGKYLRSLSYLLFIKTKTRSDFFSTSVCYMETPNKLRDLYSHLDLKLDL